MNLIKKETKIKINQKQNNNLRKTGDVLFISGYIYNDFPKGFRYRILHQIEQLKAGDLISDVCYFLDLDPLLVKDYRFIIFYRCPWTPMLKRLLNMQKN